MRSFQHAIEFGRTAAMFQIARREYPGVPARIVLAAVKNDGPESVSQYICGATDGGHDWPRGIEEHERCLCCYCGMDGDA